MVRFCSFHQVTLISKLAEREVESRLSKIRVLQRQNDNKKTLSVKVPQLSSDGP